MASISAKPDDVVYRRIDWHMSNWERYMRSIGLLSLAYSASQGAMGSSDFEGMCRDSDQVCARAVDALIQDLRPAQQAAVWVEHGLTTVWRFPRLNRAKLYEEAKEEIERGLKARGVH